MILFVEVNALYSKICYSHTRGDDNMLGYVLVEDIFDEMIENISYIKLKSYLGEREN